MQTNQLRIEKKMQLWSLLGPLLVLLTLFVLMFKVSIEHAYVPIAALIGVPICWQWRLKGLAFVLSAFTLYLGIHYFRFGFEGKLWDLGLDAALSLGFVVTALSVKEFESLFFILTSSRAYEKASDGLQTQDELDQIKLLLAQEKEAYQAQISVLENQLAAQTAQVVSQEQFLSLSREEFLNECSKNNQMANELALLKTELNRVTEDYDDLSMERTRLVEELIGCEAKIKHGSADQDKLLVLHETILQKEVDLDNNQLLLNDLQMTIAEQQNQINFFTSELNRVKGINNTHERLSELALKEREKLRQALSDLEEGSEKSLREKSFYEQEILSLQAKIQHDHQAFTEVVQNLESVKEELTDQKLAIEQAQIECHKHQAHIDLLKLDHHSLQEQLTKVVTEKEDLEKQIEALQQQIQEGTHVLQQVEANDKEEEANYRRTLGLYNQLRKQFEEKSAMLDNTRKELFYTQEALLAIEKEWEELNRYDRNEVELALEKEWIASQQKINVIKAENHALSEIVTLLTKKLQP